MARSSTKRKSKFKANPQQIVELKQSVEQAVRYVDTWKKRELESLVLHKKTAVPVCIPVSKTRFAVGRYGLKKSGNLWTAVDSRDYSEYTFSRRITALLYALCQQTGHKRIANQILQYDSEVIKLSDQLNIFTHHKESAKRKGDHWRHDHYYIMSSDIQFRLEEAKNQLEKSIDLAKYFKVWTD